MIGGWDDLTLKRLKRGIAAAEDRRAAEQEKADALARGELWIDPARGGGYVFQQLVPSLPLGMPDDVRQQRDLAWSILLDGALALGGYGVRLDGRPAGDVPTLTAEELALMAQGPQTNGQRCWSFTQDGELCRSPALPGDSYCRVHLDPSKRHEDRPPRGTRKFCGALQRNGETCRAITEHSSGYCGVHRGKLLALPGVRLEVPMKTAGKSPAAKAETWSQRPVKASRKPAETPEEAAAARAEHARLREARLASREPWRATLREQ